MAAKEHPATIGRSERYVIPENLSPMKSEVKRTEKTGSEAYKTQHSSTSLRLVKLETDTNKKMKKEDHTVLFTTPPTLIT
jgi:hypothetical protein